MTQEAKLTAFFKERGIKKNYFAAELGITSPTLKAYMDGKSVPSASRRRLIEVLTGGDVLATDWDLSRCEERGVKARERMKEIRLNDKRLKEMAENQGK